MIPCRITTEHSTDHAHGWNKQTCTRCGRAWHAPGQPADWKGDPVYCEAIPEWWEFGAWTTIVLGIFKINRHNYLWLKSRLGFERKCGCHDSAEVMNTYGQKLRGILGRFRYNSKTKE